MNIRVRGLTLIELLVAIAIFAILGVMSWRAMSHALDSHDKLKAEFETWQHLSRALSFVENDLSQIATRDINNANSLPALQLTTHQDGSASLVFWRMDGERGTRLTGYDFSDGALQLLRWTPDDISQPPTKEPLLTGVTSLRWTFTDGQTSTGWQPTWPPQPERKQEVPAGVKLELDIAGIGKVTRTYALR